MSATALFPRRTPKQPAFRHVEKNLTMNFSTALLGAVLYLFLLPVVAISEAKAQQPASTPPAGDAAQNPSSVPTGTQTTTLPPQSVQPQGAAPLRVMVGKSLLINTTERLRRISVTDPTVAYATVITPTQILVHGRSPGEVSLLIWDELERSRSFDLRVDVDVSAAAEEERRVFPEEQIAVSPSRSAIVLSGHVSTEDVYKRAGMIAEAYSKNVVNVLTFGPVGAQEVLLEVKFAEVDRTALTQLGINLFSTGAGNTVGTVQTGQFGGVKPGPISDPATTNQTTISDALNLFFFNPQVHLGGVIKALQSKNLLQILAET